MTINEFICICLLTIQDKWTSVISTIGSVISNRREKKIKSKYKKALSKFEFVLNPMECADRLVVMNGTCYRVQFANEGFLVRDDTKKDIFVNDQLTIIQILSRIQRQNPL